MSIRYNAQLSLHKLCIKLDFQLVVDQQHILNSYSKQNKSYIQLWDLDKSYIVDFLYHGIMEEYM